MLAVLSNFLSRLYPMSHPRAMIDWQCPSGQFRDIPPHRWALFTLPWGGERVCPTGQPEGPDGDRCAKTTTNGLGRK